MDLLERLAKLVDCDPAGSPLCRALGAAGEVGRAPRGLRVGFALPCHDPGGPLPGKALRGALRGDWRDAELAGASFADDRWNVFALRPESAAEEAMVRHVHDQFVACVEGRGCALDVPEPMRETLAAPEGADRPVAIDDAGHLYADGPLHRHLGRFEQWLVVAEGGRECE